MDGFDSINEDTAKKTQFGYEIGCVAWRSVVWIVVITVNNIEDEYSTVQIICGNCLYFLQVKRKLRTTGLSVGLITSIIKARRTHSTYSAITGTFCNFIVFYLYYTSSFFCYDFSYTYVCTYKTLFI